MDTIEIIENMMEYIEEVSKALGYPINIKDYYIEDMGCPHNQPKCLKKGYNAVYIFVYETNNTKEFLKIGKANSKSNARFTSQHYGFSSRSTLAKSLNKDKDFTYLHLNKRNTKKWMLNNLHRINIYIDEKLGRETTELVESILHYSLRPKYEGR